MYPLRSSSKQLLFLLLSETISCSLRHLLVPKRYISLPSRACRKKVSGREAGEVGAELLRLHNSPLGEVAAGDPGREAEVVLDGRAASCLTPAGDHPVDQ